MHSQQMVAKVYVLGQSFCNKYFQLMAKFLKIQKMFLRSIFMTNHVVNCRPIVNV